MTANSFHELATPCYVFSPRVARARYKRLRAALGTELVVSLKANPHVELLRQCSSAFVDGVEIASLGEFRAAIDAGLPGPKYITNPAMPAELMDTGMHHGATLVVDSVEQAVQVASRPGCNQGVTTMLRLNIGACVERLQRPDHFGMSASDLVEAALTLNQHGVNVVGVHIFGGSNTFLQYSASVVPTVRAVMSRVEEALGHRLTVAALGGGFPAEEMPSDDSREWYSHALQKAFKGYRITHEAGRAIFSASGAFVTRIIATKRLGDRVIAICDGGINQNYLLARSEGFRRNLQVPVVLSAGAPSHPNSDTLPVHFVGSSCSAQDVIGISKPASLPTTGDLCVFGNCGAYNATYTLSPFLTLLPAAIYVIDDLPLFPISP